MALVVVRAVPFGNGGVTQPSPFTAAAFSATTGNLIVVAFRAGSTVTFSNPTDTAGNAYTPLTAVVSGAVRLQLFYAKNITGNASNVVSIATSASCNSPAGMVWEISGADKTSPLDAQQTGSNAGTSPITSSAFTTTLANEVIVAFATDNGTGTQTWTQNAGYASDGTAPPTGSPLTYAFGQHNIVSSIQTGVTTSATYSGSVGPTLSLIGVATFKAAAVAAGLPNFLMMMGSGT